MAKNKYEIPHDPNNPNDHDQAIAEIHECATKCGLTIQEEPYDGGTRVLVLGDDDALETFYTFSLNHKYRV